MSRTNHQIRGSLTLEILIAFFVLSLTLTSTLLLVFGTQDNSLDMHLTLENIYKRNSELSAHLSLLKENIHTHSILPGFDETYISPCVKQVIKKYDDTTIHGTTQRDITVLIGATDEAKKIGEGCDPFPPQDAWEHYTSVASLLPDTASGTAIALHAHNGMTYAYITTASTSLNTPDIFIFDVTDPLTPLFIASKDMGSGIIDIRTTGNFAYVLQNANTNQLQVLDIADPENPLVIASRSLPTISYTCTPASDPCRAGKSMFYYDGRIYIGTQYFSFGTTSLTNNEFHIFCVDDQKIPNCNPHTPKWLGSLNVNHNIYDIVVQGSFAYLATSDDIGELMMVDISHPESLLHPDATNMKYDAKTTTGAASTEDGRSIFVLGSIVYLGRQRVNLSTERDLYILDASVPTAITERTSVKLPIKSGDYVSDIVSQGNMLFISTTNTLNPLIVFTQTLDSLTSSFLCSLSSNHTRIQKFLYHDNMIFTANQTGPLMDTYVSTPSCYE